MRNGDERWHSLDGRHMWSMKWEWMENGRFPLNRSIVAFDSDHKWNGRRTWKTHNFAFEPKIVPQTKMMNSCVNWKMCTLIYTQNKWTRRKPFQVQCFWKCVKTLFLFATSLVLHIFFFFLFALFCDYESWNTKDSCGSLIFRPIETKKEKIVFNLTV